MDNNKLIKQTVGAVMKTTDYDAFSFLDGNRRINARNYSKLLNSMKEEPLEIPILVNEKYEIIDGQHRYTVCKELGLPIYYYIVKGYGIEQVKRANMVSSNWTKEDFLESHIKDGKDQYKDFKDILDVYNLHVSDVIKLFAKVQDISAEIAGKLFENGNFNFDKKEEVVEFLDALQDFDFFPYYNSKQFISAFTRLYFDNRYDHSIMVNKLKTRKNELVKKSSYKDYLVLLTQQIYSYRATSKNTLLYDKETGKFYSC